MKMSVLLVVTALIVGTSAMYALGWKILMYPAAWAVVGAIFFAWNKMVGPSIPAPHDAGPSDASPS